MCDDVWSRYNTSVADTTLRLKETLMLLLRQSVLRPCAAVQRTSVHSDFAVRLMH